MPYMVLWSKSETRWAGSGFALPHGFKARPESWLNYWFVCRKCCEKQVSRGLFTTRESGPVWVFHFDNAARLEKPAAPKFLCV